MARPLNRLAISINLGFFIVVSIFCVSVEAPLIQHDIQKRCQATLLKYRLPIRGLTVSGRDVVLSGEAESEILSRPVRLAVENVSGVRTVMIRVSSGGVLPESAADSAVSASLPQDVQEKIDRVLENQGIFFKPDTSILTPESELAFDKIAAYMAEAPGLLCEIRGYDGVGGGGRNWVLALQRTIAVEDFLESKGVATWRLSTRALHAGEAPQGRATNRSIDLVMKAKARG